MKKLLACGLILAMLTSTGAMCFADDGVELVQVMSTEEAGETQDEKTAEKEELENGLKEIKENKSLTWKEKVSRAWEYVKDFVKRHYVAIGTVTVSAALLVLACIFGPKFVGSIVNLFKSKDEQPVDEKKEEAEEVKENEQAEEEVIIEEEKKEEVNDEEKQPVEESYSLDTIEPELWTGYFKALSAYLEDTYWMVENLEKYEDEYQDDSVFREAFIINVVSILAFARCIDECFALKIDKEAFFSIENILKFREKLSFKDMKTVREKLNDIKTKIDKSLQGPLKIEDSQSFAINLYSEAFCILEQCKQNVIEGNYLSAHGLATAAQFIYEYNPISFSFAYSVKEFLKESVVEPLLRAISTNEAEKVNESIDKTVSLLKECMVNCKIV